MPELWEKIVTVFQIMLTSWSWIWLKGGFRYLPTQQPCQMGKPHLGTSHHPWLPRTFRRTKSSWWPHHELGLQDEMLGIRMGQLKTCVVFRWESFTDCGNNASWENFPISLSKSMPYPKDKPAICNMSIDSVKWNIIVTA